MTLVEARRLDEQPVERSRRLPGLRVWAAAAVLLGLLARLHSGSDLWLDEALTVHIARLPLGQLHAALRQDGAPPVYYVLLHGWMRLFGQSPTAVRSLSAVAGVAALPLAWVLGRRWRDRTTAGTFVLLLASSPFAVRYSAEGRMYSLVVLEVMLGGLLLLRAWDRPSVGRLAPVAALAAVLVLTHYWSLYLLACLGVGLLWRARTERPARRLVAALLAGGLLVLPWLPTLLFQLQHTGTPWAPASSPAAALLTVGFWGGGSSGSGRLLALLLFGLPVVALLGREHPSGLLLRLPVDRPAARLLGLAAGPLLLGLVVGLAFRAGYAVRYSSVALPAGLLLTAVGLAALPRRARLLLTALAVGLGLVAALQVPFDDRRTQAGRIASALRPRLAPGDLVVYCPDQLGVAVQDLLPPGTDQVVFPTLARPDRIDWVDYAQRNGRARPAAFLAKVLARAAGRPVWLVTEDSYRTFGTACEQLAGGLRAARPSSTRVVTADKHFDEKASLYRFAG